MRIGKSLAQAVFIGGHCDEVDMIGHETVAPDFCFKRAMLNRAKRGIRNFCDTLRPVPSTLSARPVPDAKITQRLCLNLISRSGIRARTTSGRRQ